MCCAEYLGFFLFVTWVSKFYVLMGTVIGLCCCHRWHHHFSLLLVHLGIEAGALRLPVLNSIISCRYVTEYHAVCGESRLDNWKTPLNEWKVFTTRALASSGHSSIFPLPDIWLQLEESELPSFAWSSAGKGCCKTSGSKCSSWVKQLTQWCCNQKWHHQ